MDLNIQGIKWVGNIYQKFEAVCQDVDDIVSQDAVKYLENQVQNVGDSVKKFYSGVVHELLPFPNLADSEYESHSVALTNSIGFPVESVAGHKDNKKFDEENPVHDFTESLQESKVIDIANNQQVGVLIKHNQVIGETCSDSLGVENSYITQVEAGEVGDDSRETSGAKKEKFHTSIEEVARESVPKQMNLMSLREEESLEFPICDDSSDSSDTESEFSITTKDKIDVNLEQNSSLAVEENVMNSSTSEVLSSQSHQSHGEEESVKVSLFSESSDAVDEDTHLAEVSPDASVSSERAVTRTEPLCSRSSIASDSLYSKSLGSYSFEIESCKNSSGDSNLGFSDSSMVQICCEPAPHVARQMMESQDGLAFSGYCQSVESNDKSLFSSIESKLEDIDLNDEPKREENCVFVDDSELYAASCRAQKLRSYKKRIQDAFSSKKRLAKEYENLAIWYGDTDFEPSGGFSQTFLPYNSRKYTSSKNVQVQGASETDWELL